MSRGFSGYRETRFQTEDDYLNQLQVHRGFPVVRFIHGTVIFMALQIQTTPPDSMKELVQHHGSPFIPSSFHDFFNLFGTRSPAQKRVYSA